jgi:hypothetical protein
MGATSLTLPPCALTWARSAGSINYIARSLLETGGFRRNYTLNCEEPLYHDGVDNVREAVRAALGVVPRPDGPPKCSRPRH